MDKIGEKRVALVVLVVQTAELQMHPRDAERVLMPVADAYALAVLDELRPILGHRPDWGAEADAGGVPLSHCEDCPACKAEAIRDRLSP